MTHRQIMALRTIRALRVLLASTDGVTALEYGLIAALIAVVIIAAVQLLGTNISSTFNTAASSIGAG